MLVLLLGQSYNSWLREENREQSNTLVKNMDSLQEALQELQLVLPSETTTERSQEFRVNSAIVHLTAEILLLVTFRENN